MSSGFPSSVSSSFDVFKLDLRSKFSCGFSERIERDLLNSKELIPFESDFWSSSLSISENFFLPLGTYSSGPPCTPYSGSFQKQNQNQKGNLQSVQIKNKQKNKTPKNQIKNDENFLQKETGRKEKKTRSVKSNSPQMIFYSQNTLLPINYTDKCQNIQSKLLERISKTEYLENKKKELLLEKIPQIKEKKDIKTSLEFFENEIKELKEVEEEGEEEEEVEEEEEEEDDDDDEEEEEEELEGEETEDEIEEVFQEVKKKGTKGSAEIENKEENKSVPSENIQESPQTKSKFSKHSQNMERKKQQQKDSHLFKNIQTSKKIEEEEDLFIYPPFTIISTLPLSVSSTSGSSQEISSNNEISSSVESIPQIPSSIPSNQTSSSLTFLEDLIQQASLPNYEYLQQSQRIHPRRTIKDPTTGSIGTVGRENGTTGDDLTSIQQSGSKTLDLNGQKILDTELLSDEKNVLVDKWGFFVEDESQIHESRKQKEKEEERYDKWKLMISQWSIYSGEKKTKLRHRCRKGIPEKIRADLWKKIVHLDESAYLIKASYEELLSKESNFEEQISRDIGRTFPKNIHFQTSGSAMQKSLFNVLKAYSNFDIEVGYCQGMGFLAASLLLYMPEREVFAMLHRMCRDPLYRLSGFYSPGFPLLHETLYVHDQLLELSLPKLANHFKGQNILATMYATQWYTTIFSNSLSFRYVVRIWDLFLVEGLRVCFRFGIGVLAYLQSDLLKLKFEEIIPKLRNIQPVIQLPVDEFIKLSLDLNLSWKKIEKFEKEYHTKDSN